MSNSLVSLLLLLVLSGASVPGFNEPQSPRRERRARPIPTATPTATPTPSRTASPSPTPIPQSSPQSSPSPAPTRGPLRADTTTTPAELQTRITGILRKPELSAAMIGIKVVSLDTGRVLFEENANKLLRPASNMKLYTVSTALDRLSPDFRFNTSVYAAAKPDANGVIRGDLTIYGRGDPSIAARFNDGDYFKGIDDLATRIAGAGVKRIDGDLVGDESYFSGPRYGSGWEWEDLTWYYGAEVSALTVNDNALDLFIKPGAQVGAQGVVTTGPPDPLLTIVNGVKTGPKGSKRELSVKRELGANTLEVGGTIPLDDAGYSGGVGISHPALLFLSLLRSALVKQGITVKGKSRTIDARSGRSTVPTGPLTLVKLPAYLTPPAPVEITNLQSPPFSVVAAHTLKPSQNLYTEIILRTLGKTMAAASPATNTATNEDSGIEVVKGFLKEAGLSPDALALSDGSGLSRNDMVTAEATVQLLTYMSKHRYAQTFRDALPIAGVDGTLRVRFRGTVAENNLRAKTGSLSSAASLSGYVTTAAGERLAFSIMVNNYPPDANARALCIDPIGILLASYAGQP